MVLVVVLPVAVMVVVLSAFGDVMVVVVEVEMVVLSVWFGL